MRDVLDRFYTPTITAKKCINSILNIDQYDLIIEPSAGSGSFSSQIEGCVSFDICPQHPDIIKEDYLRVTTGSLPEFSNLLIVGNPPFGQRSSTAKKFISHSIHLGASTIAFILPDTFRKYMNQRMFSSEWRLVSRERLISNSFILDDTTIDIPCSFFIWTKLPDFLPHIDMRDKKYPPAEEFTFLKRGDNNADFCINGNTGKIKNVEDVTNSKAEHYIQVNEGYSVEKIRTELGSIEFDMSSSVSGGVSWVGQNDILSAWERSSSV